MSACERRDPGVDLRLVDEAEGQAHVVAAAPVGEEQRAGHDPDAAATAAAASEAASPPSGSVSHEKKPPCGVVQRTSAGIDRSSAASMRSRLLR